MEGLGRAGKDGPEEATLKAQETLGFLGVLESGFALWVTKRLVAVLLVGRQRRKREQSQRDVVCSFGREEVPVRCTSKPFD